MAAGINSIGVRIGIDSSVDSLDFASGGDGALDQAALRELYSHCRNEDGTRESSRVQKWKAAAGWVSLTSDAATSINESLAPPHEDFESRRRSWWRLKNNLAAIDWPNHLGFPGCRIRCEIRDHGKSLVGRFQGAGLDGNHARNELAASACGTL